MNIEINELRTLLRHNPETGEMFWHHGLSSLEYLWGRQALNTLNAEGYYCGSIKGVSVRAHRVIWALHFGYWPTQVIDHINRVRSDNRIANLRDVSPAENNLNRTANNTRKNRTAFSSTYAKGVIWNAKRGVWTVQFKRHGRRYWGGYHPNKDDAIMAAKAIESTL